MNMERASKVSNCEEFKPHLHPRDIPVAEMGLSVNSTEALESHGVLIGADFDGLSDADLAFIAGLSSRTIHQLRDALKRI